MSDSYYQWANQQVQNYNQQNGTNIPQNYWNTSVSQRDASMGVPTYRDPATYDNSGNRIYTYPMNGAQSYQPYDAYGNNYSNNNNNYYRR